MNWPEFVAHCEATMKAKEIDPQEVTVRLEVSDSSIANSSIGIYRNKHGDLVTYLILTANEGD